jgi:hypothetical protein
MFARTASRTAALVALSALATAQAPAFSIAPKSHASLLELTQGPSLAGIPVGPGASGLVIGLWIDPTFGQLGSMTGELFDAAGNLEYSLVATVSEYIAAGSTLRFGGISGKLYKGSAPAGIKVSGDWTIDPVTNKGTFKLTCYLSAISPTAPLLAIGSMEGVLGKPLSALAGGDEEAVPVPSAGAGSPGSLGSFSSKGATGGGGGTPVQRDFRGRWKMI